MKNFIILSLGSNEGDRIHNLKLCLKELEGFVSIAKISSIYESDALLLPNSPPEWNKNFYNICVSGKTNLAPIDLLEKVKEVELKIAGEKRDLRWSPRAIDVDIICYNDEVLNLETSNGEKLFIPHKSTTERTFVMWPLAEIEPDWRHPSTGENLNKTAIELAQNFGIKFPDELETKATPLNTKKLQSL
jgi:2-amino-4-hydroxy-6-hydroxymethyldihydropteridine diphosphokinase